MFLVWGIFCGRHLCAGAARQQPSRACWGEAICEGGGHPPTCSSWKFFCTLLGSNLELLVMFAFLNWDLKPLAIMILGIRMINMAMIWQSPFDTAMLITGLGCLFGTVPSKLRISAWDWRQHLRAFRHAGGELRSVRAIEIHLNHLILTQKHKSWAFWPSGCRRGFAIQGSWRGQKPRKKNRKPKTGSKFGARELCRMQKLPSRLSGRRGVGFFEPTISSTAFEALRGVALVRPKDLAQGRNDVVRGAREAGKRMCEISWRFSVCQKCS